MALKRRDSVQRGREKEGTALTALGRTQIVNASEFMISIWPKNGTFYDGTATRNSYVTGPYRLSAVVRRWLGTQKGGAGACEEGKLRSRGGQSFGQRHCLALDFLQLPAECSEIAPGVFQQSCSRPATKMIAKLLAVLGLTLVAGVAAGRTRSMHGGDPALHLADTNGTAQVFQASESAVLFAISNAFDTGDDNPMGYRGMHLYPATEQSYLVPNWHPTNGFVLFPL